jgi:DNA-binding MarR family transcriptional regulator
MGPFEQLIMALKQVHENTIQVLQPKEEEGLSHGHMFLLFMIYRKGSIKTIDISHYFGITPGAATAIADKLENLGLIVRERDQKDRRVVVISLSKGGLDFVENKKNQHVKMFEEILKDFSIEEILSIVQTLTQISDAIAKYKTSATSANAD